MRRLLISLGRRLIALRRSLIASRFRRAAEIDAAIDGACSIRGDRSRLADDEEADGEEDGEDDRASRLILFEDLIMYQYNKYIKR